MIAALMIYLIVIGMTFAAAGLMLERVAAAHGRPRRWVWAGALSVTIACGIAMPWTAAGDAQPVSVGERLAVLLVENARSEDGVASAWRGRFLFDPQSVDALARLSPWISGLWAFGSTVLVVVYLAGAAAISRRRREWRDADVQGLRVSVASNEGPAVVGLWRPRIVLPEWALHLEAAELGLLLEHEREHLRARDPLLVHAAAAAVLLMPWNPAVWWMLARLKLALEVDCDARVLGGPVHRGVRTVADARAYGELLLNVAARASNGALLGSAMLGRSSNLTRRFAAMYPTRRRFLRARSAAATAMALGLLAAALLMPVPQLRAAGQGEPETPLTPGKASGVAPPTVVRSVAAEYTAAAKDKDIQGEVHLRAVVETDGTVSRIRVTKSLDSVNGLDDAAVAAASKWLFEPATKDGRPVPVWIELVMEFRLR